MNEWATTIIAGLVLVVAWMQWLTAHKRLLLDLFEKRFSAYDSLVQAFRPVWRDGAIRNMADLQELRKAAEETRFLFGGDIRRLMVEIINCGAVLATAEHVIEDQNAPQRQEWIDRKYRALRRLIEISDSLPELFEPYMGIHDKRVWDAVTGFFKERNRIRLSYAEMVKPTDTAQPLTVAQPNAGRNEDEEDRGRADNQAPDT